MARLEIKHINQDYIDDIMDIQNSVINNLHDKAILRFNSRDVFLESLAKPNISIGAFDNEKLVGFCIAIHPKTDDENLSLFLTDVDISNRKVMIYKVCMILPEYRGNSFQQVSGEIVLDEIKKQGYDMVCCTVSPDNPHSYNNMFKLGFTRGNKIESCHGLTTRHIYYKFL